MTTGWARQRVKTSTRDSPPGFSRSLAINSSGNMGKPRFFTVTWLTPLSSKITAQFLEVEGHPIQDLPVPSPGAVDDFIHGQIGDRAIKHICSEHRVASCRTNLGAQDRRIRLEQPGSRFRDGNIVSKLVQGLPKNDEFRKRLCASPAAARIAGADQRTASQRAPSTEMNSTWPP